MDDEQYWSKDTTLRYAAGDLLKIRTAAVNPYSLSSVSEERFNPFY
jgi:hypothetical protein